jgi:Ca-activated chloride channel family protein
MFTACSSAVHAETGERDDDVTSAPYFFIQDGDPSIDRLPLKGTEVRTSINGIIAETYVTQTYANEGEHPISASYVFPASTRVSVHGMTMEIGGQRIKAVIKEKEEAEQDYEEARSEGKSASLLEEKRSNVFTMDVANIMPGDTVRIELHYTEMVESTDGVCQFVFPTVVGPRYAGVLDTEDAEEAEWVETPYLEEGVDPESTYDIMVNVSTGVPITDLSCTTHDVDVEWKKNSEAKVTLSDPGDFAGDRDFILEYQMTGEELESGLMLYEGEEENYFLLTMQPPARYEPTDCAQRIYFRAGCIRFHERVSAGYCQGADPEHGPEFKEYGPVQSVSLFGYCIGDVSSVGGSYRGKYRLCPETHRYAGRGRGHRACSGAG